MPNMHLHHHPSLPSTQDEAARLAALGAPDRTVVSAEVQTAGRGRHSRAWDSPAGNLHMTVLVRSPLPPARSPELGFVAAMALVDALDRHLPRPARLKWPNDVLASRGKIAGILIEHAHGAALLGIGVNIAHSPPAPYPTTSLGAEMTPLPAPAPAALRDALLAGFDRWRAVWAGQGFGEIRRGWLERAHPVGTRLRVSETGQTGVFAGLDASGALLLDTALGRVRVLSGQVAMP